ncbi:hypothetical protein Cni_G27568 [Canna indica]|uniref:Uncharacterized protein n=1 Tax=Canna indica TaxID=4628 RepID=A0AAQ3QN27_9LILI|nr:hypothetical protein Cni_G27568 [Canna indica]
MTTESSEEERLVQMVHDFMESDVPPPPSFPSTSRGISVHQQQTLLLLEGILGDSTAAETKVFEKALEYVRESDGERNRNKVKKRLMMRLRMDGYDASLCRSSRGSTTECPGGVRPVSPISRFLEELAKLPISSSSMYLFFPTGDYEYIDIVLAGEENGAASTTRVIVDIDFRSQFELARPTMAYTQLAGALPAIFVGKEEKLKKVVTLLCSAAQQSLRERGLHIPPWRRSSYMQSKWLPCCSQKVTTTMPYGAQEMTTTTTTTTTTKLKGRHGGSTKNKGRPGEAAADSKRERGEELAAGLSSQFSDLSINCC